MHLLYLRGYRRTGSGAYGGWIEETVSGWKRGSDAGGMVSRAIYVWKLHLRPDHVH